MSKGLRKVAVDPRQLALLFGDDAETKAGTKRCCVCRAEKPLEAFYRATKRRDGRQTRCIECVRADNAAKAAERPEPAPITEKVCRKCGVVKSLEAFHRARTRKCGRVSRCKECLQAERSTPEYRERHRFYGRHYRRSEKGRLNYLAYYRSETGKATYRRYHKSERRRRWRAKYRESGMDKAVYDKWSKGEKGKAWRHRKRTTPEYRAKMKAYRSRPHVRKRLNARARASQHKREARMLGLEATFTRRQWRKALDHFGRRCAYCGCPGKMSQDHFIPVVLGGPYTRANIVPACLSCNSRKRCSPPEVWCSPEVYAKILTYFATLSSGTIGGTS